MGHKYVISDAQKAELKTKNPGKKIAVLKIMHPDKREKEKLQVAVFPPSLEAWTRFKDENSDKRLSRQAGDNLIVSCLAHPSLEEYRAMEQEFPGLPMSITNKLTDLAAVELEAEVDFLD